MNTLSDAELRTLLGHFRSATVALASSDLPLDLIDADSITFRHFNQNWDLGHIFAASGLSWKDFNGVYLDVITETEKPSS